MAMIKELRGALDTAPFLARLREAYGCGEAAAHGHAQRYRKALEGFAARFGEAYLNAGFFSAPGRTEVGGNHTDHQSGRVLAAAVDLDVVGVAAPNHLGEIRILSEGFPEDRIDLADLAPRAQERQHAAALIRGVAAQLKAWGYPVEGFDAYTVSTVPKGSGLSSSAAFEVLVGTMLNGLFAGGRISPVELARAGQFAENEYFGKASGLMDQTASAVGGVVAIDFADPAAPEIRPVRFDLEAAGYALCIVETGGDHADLSDAYSAIPKEMRRVAALLGQKTLRGLDEAALFARFAEARAAAGDRAVLRAMHFFADDRRAAAEAEALERGDFAGFLQLVRASGESSVLCLQNIFPCGEKARQPVAVALALCGSLLGGEGAVRVHGGGFAGTVQAFVPLARVEEFRAGVERCLGEGRCHVLSFRPAGGLRIW